MEFESFHLIFYVCIATAYVRTCHIWSYSESAVTKVTGKVASVTWKIV